MSVKLQLQLYSLRNETAKDPMAALKKAVATGIRSFEPANGKGDVDPFLGYGISTEEFNSVFGPLGCGIGSAHMGPLSMETMPKIMEAYKAVGNKTIVEAIKFFTSYDHLMKRCEEYNEMGKYLVENGMNPLCYHNHYHEYQLLNGKEVLYYIEENTDPKYFQFEIDTGWVTRAGRNPIDELNHFGERVRLIHIKDFARKPTNLLIGKEDELISWETFGANNQPGDKMRPEDFVVLGTGVMDLQAIIDKANEIGVEYAVLEQDDSAIDIFDSIQQSVENLKGIKGLEI